MYSVSEKIWRLEEAFLDRIEKLENRLTMYEERIKELENKLNTSFQKQIDAILKRNLKA